MDRPIKATGKYNMNFIDWQNEYENIICADYDGQNTPAQSPIAGMSAEEFHALMLEDSRRFQLQQDNVEEQLLGMGENLKDIKKMKVGQTNKECSICQCRFVKGQVIRLLKCKHIFHDNCIVPWLTKRTSCPNCRVDLKE